MTNVIMGKGAELDSLEELNIEEDKVSKALQPEIMAQPLIGGDEEFFIIDDGIDEFAF